MSSFRFTESALISRSGPIFNNCPIRQRKKAIKTSTITSVGGDEEEDVVDVKRER